MPSLSVITAAGPASDAFLPALADSIRTQTPHQDWTLSWLVVCDGPGETANKSRAHLAEALGADSTWANTDRYWAGASRNRALAHCTSDYVVIVDADDILTPYALTHWADAHTQQPNTWVGFPVLDWYPDTHRTVKHPDPCPPGRVPAGEWLTHFASTNTHPIHPISVLWPTDQLIHVGGWSASPTAQDSQPVLVASTKWDGWWYPLATHLYRKHDNQITKGGATRPLAAVGDDARLLATRQALSHSRTQLVAGTGHGSTS